MQFFCHLLWILQLTEYSTFAIQDAIGVFFAEKLRVGIDSVSCNTKATFFRNF